MDLDFLEIGTCNFKTMIQSASDTDIGMSVEPIKYYLESLPNKEGVIKVNCAISKDNAEREVVIYYVPEKIINQKNLPRWVKGSSRIGSPHPAYKKLINDKQLDSNDIFKETVKEIPISKLLDDYDVQSIKTLKIDTEGSDCYIMLHLEDYLKDKNEKYYPNKIIFETNFLAEKNLVEKVIDRYKLLGYEVTSRNLDTVLERKS